MTQRIRRTAFLAIFLGVSFLAFADDPQLIAQADRTFVKAVQQQDAKELGALLDQDFTWTTSAGKTLNRSDVLAHFPELAGNETASADTPHLYGDVAVVTAVHDRAHAARFWVKRDGGWRLLIYHEATLVEKTEPAKPHAGGCENPCQTLPYTPKNDAEKQIILSWQALETAVTNHDSAGWAPHIADEFLLVNSNNDHVLTKADRMAILDKQKQSGAGSAPVPLLSAEMFDFGDTAIMRAQHQRGDEKPIHVSRIWIKRDGKWIMAFSEQTVVQ